MIEWWETGDDVDDDGWCLIIYHYHYVICLSECRTRGSWCWRKWAVEVAHPQAGTARPRADERTSMRATESTRRSWVVLADLLAAAAEETLRKDGISGRQTALGTADVWGAVIAGFPWLPSLLASQGMAIFTAKKIITGQFDAIVQNCFCVLFQYF